jgi:hypothetical protein
VSPLKREFENSLFAANSRTGDFLRPLPPAHRHHLRPYYKPVVRIRTNLKWVYLSIFRINQFFATDKAALRVSFHEMKI